MLDSNVREITPDEIATFQRDGVVCLKGCIDQNWIDRLRAAVDRDIANPGPKHYGYQGEGAGQFHGNQDLWQTDPDCADYCLHSPLPGLAAQMMKAAKVNLYFDHLFVKMPGSASRTPWHNDQPYWPVGGRDVMSFWLALDHVSVESGAVEYILGSHKWDRWFQPRGFSSSDKDYIGYDRNPAYEPIPDFDAIRDQYEIKAFEVEPGDLIAFHALTVHGAGGNRTSDRMRRGYAVRYTGDDSFYDPRIGTSKLLLNDKLASGQPLDSERFPVAWRRACPLACPE